MIQRIITQHILQSLSSFSFSTRVRYAPSPTGMMHIGGVRTALFNYLFAKKYGGKFILRIQDTDQKRNVAGSIQNIYQTLKWLQISQDQSSQNPNAQYSPYIQSQRLTVYKSIQKSLLKNNLAYACFCQHQIKTESNSQSKKKKKQQKQDQQEIIQPYDGKCRNLTFNQVKQKIKAGQEYAVRIKSDILQKPDYFKDQNYGMVSWGPFDDFVIVKRDGYPTFHFANVVDDWKMHITHVIRGEEWLTNTSKHIFLYKVLGAAIPKFFHLPLILNQNGKKLAKRDPTSSLATLKSEYQPQAIRNFIFRLGWNPKQIINEKQEIQLLSDHEMIQQFSQEGITKSPAKFDVKILNHLNRKCLKLKWKQYQSLNKKENLSKHQKQQLQNLKKQFKQKIVTALPEAGNLTQQKLLSIWQIIHDRITTNSDIKKYQYFLPSHLLCYNSPKSLSQLKQLFGSSTILNSNPITIKLYDQLLLQKNKIILHNLRLIFEHILSEEQFEEVKIAQKISQFLVQNQTIKNQQLFHLFRYIITGSKSGPSILKAVQLIGRDQTIKRLQTFYHIIKESQSIHKINVVI